MQQTTGILKKIIVKVNNPKRKKIKNKTPTDPPQ
jgi:hypothetical protein